MKKISFNARNLGKLMIAFLLCHSMLNSSASAQGHAPFIPFANLDKLPVDLLEASRLGKASLGHRDPVAERHILDGFLSGYTASVLALASTERTPSPQNVSNCLYQMAVIDNVFQVGSPSDEMFGTMLGGSVLSHASIYSKGQRINAVEAMHRAILRDCAETYGPGLLPYVKTGRLWLSYRDEQKEKKLRK